MKKRIFLLLFILLALCGEFFGVIGGLSEWGERNFRHLMESPAARAVFDLDEKEAETVFGDAGEAMFL